MRGLWHNSFADVVADSTGAQPAALQALALNAHSAGIIASVPQGRTLRINAQQLAWEVNRPFPTMVMQGSDLPDDVQLDTDLTLSVLAPTKTRLDKLKKDWDREVRKLLAGQSDGGLVAEILDTSVPNLSSIVVLATCAGKTMLLTGDAGGDDILDGLEAAGLLAAGGTLKVDVLKMPHHGSIRNVDERFLTTIVADHYVFSANGRDGNPDEATLELLTRLRGSDAYSMYFTNHDGEADLRAALRRVFRDRSRSEHPYLHGALPRAA